MRDGGPGPPLPPALLVRYSALHLIGAGGMGTVLACLDRELNRQVAVKMLAAGLDQKARDRFAREARALAAVRHANVLEIFDVGEADGTPFLVTEFLDAEPAGVGAPCSHAASVMDQVAAGLRAVHEAGIVHRDLKPDNVLVTDDGRAVLIDFGLAKRPDLETVTAAGILWGTPAYMAPELWRGASPSPLTDWFAWGATFFYLLEGGPPFSVMELREAAGGKRLPPPAYRSVLPGSPFREVLAACLEADPERRGAGPGDPLVPPPASTPVASSVPLVNTPRRRPRRATEPPELLTPTPEDLSRRDAERRRRRRAATALVTVALLAWGASLNLAPGLVEPPPPNSPPDRSPAWVHLGKVADAILTAPAISSVLEPGSGLEPGVTRSRWMAARSALAEAASAHHLLQALKEVGREPAGRGDYSRLARLAAAARSLGPDPRGEPDELPPAGVLTALVRVLSTQVKSGPLPALALRLVDEIAAEDIVAASLNVGPRRWISLPSRGAERAPGQLVLGTQRDPPGDVVLGLSLVGWGKTHTLELAFEGAGGERLLAGLGFPARQQQAPEGFVSRLGMWVRIPVELLPPWPLHLRLRVLGHPPFEAGSTSAGFERVYLLESGPPPGEWATVRPPKFAWVQSELEAAQEVVRANGRLWPRGSSEGDGRSLRADDPADWGGGGRPLSCPPQRHPEGGQGSPLAVG